MGGSKKMLKNFSVEIFSLQTTDEAQKKSLVTISRHASLREASRMQKKCNKTGKLKEQGYVAKVKDEVSGRVVAELNLEAERKAKKLRVEESILASMMGV